MSIGGETMTITVEIPHEVEKQVQESIAHGDINAARRLLQASVLPAVEAALMDNQPPKSLSTKEFSEMLNKLADMAEEYIDPNCPPLSDYAVSREGIYEGYPKL
jgi:antitoxin ParD1/3/4